MHWLYFLAASFCLLIASRGFTPGWLVVLLILAALGLFLAWMLGWVNSRVSSSARNEMQILSPEELRLLREQAEARKAAAAQKAEDGPA